MEDKHLPKKVQNELPVEIELFGETLDFSELLIVKGGKKPVTPKKEGNGSCNGFICHCG